MNSRRTIIANEFFLPLAASSLSNRTYLKFKIYGVINKIYIRLLQQNLMQFDTPTSKYNPAIINYFCGRADDAIEFYFYKKKCAAGVIREIARKRLFFEIYMRNRALVNKCRRLNLASSDLDTYFVDYGMFASVLEKLSVETLFTHKWCHAFSFIKNMCSLRDNK